MSLCDVCCRLRGRVGGCPLFTVVVCRVLFAVCCLLCGVRCRLFAVRCVLRVAGCLMFVGCCLWFDDGWRCALFVAR